MTFDEMPAATDEGDVLFEGDAVFPGKSNPCIQCGTVTRWVSIGLESSVCSPECLREVWAELDFSLASVIDVKSVD